MNISSLVLEPTLFYFLTFIMEMLKHKQEINRMNPNFICQFFPFLFPSITSPSLLFFFLVWSQNSLTGKHSPTILLGAHLVSLVLHVLSSFGKWPGLLTGHSMGRESGLSLPGRFSGHKWVQGFRKC